MDQSRPVRQRRIPERLGVSITEVKTRRSIGGPSKKQPKVQGIVGKSDDHRRASDVKSVITNKSKPIDLQSISSSTSTVRKQHEVDLRIMKELHNLEAEEDLLDQELEDKDRIQRRLNTVDTATAEEIRLNAPATDEEKKEQEDKLKNIIKVIDDRISEFEAQRNEIQRKKKAIHRKKSEIQQQGKVDKCKVVEEFQLEQNLGSDEELLDDVFDYENQDTKEESSDEEDFQEVKVKSPPQRNRMELMMARQTLRQDLPVFDGRAEEWPIFLSQYNMTSVACGLTDVENLQRLQKSLRGPARETVRAMMVSGDNVQKIISILEKRYGKPSVILESMLQQVRAIPVLKAEDRSGLLHFVDQVRNLTVTAESFKCQPYINNPQLLRELLGKLPHNRQDDWGERLRKMNKEFPSMTEFSEWLEEVGDSISLVYQPPILNANIQGKAQNGNNHQWRKPHRNEKVFVAAEGKSRSGNSGGSGGAVKKCSLCSKQSHRLQECQQFIQQSLDDKWNWVKSSRHCFSCLNLGHSVQNCRKKQSCKKDGCQKEHHPLLHRVQLREKKEEEPEVVGHTIQHQEHSRVNLMILPVKLQGPKGTLSTFAMLDTGSTVTLLDAATATTLGLDGPNHPLVYKGLHPTAKEAESKSVSLQILDSKGERKFELNNVRTLGNLPLPHQSLRVSHTKKWKHLQDIELQQYECGRPTILIGQDHANLTLPLEVIQGPPNAPIAARTELGWLLTGKAGGISQHDYSYVVQEVEDEIHQMVKHYFTTESFGVKVTKEQPRSKEDQRAIQLMDSTSRRVNGRWEIGLLWKSGVKSLPDSKTAAENRLKSIERKMDQSPELSKWYVSKIEDYEKKGYVKKLTEEEAAVTNPSTWYLPHFVNYNPNKPDKPRLVFDGASKVRGVSLNDNLMQGPDMVKPLPSVLFKFRQQKYGFTADIKEMFHQVRIIEEDRSSQRFLWRGASRNKKPDSYELQVMFFGAASSPCSAQYIKNKNASEYKNELPEVYDAIVNRHYVDDYLDSSDEIDEANQLINNVIKVHSKGGFHICNWTSNSREILQQIPEELRASEVKELSLCPDLPTGRVLGLLWNSEEDSFVWKLCFHKVKQAVVDGTQVPTKRDCLKLVMSLFDPLGFLANSTVKAKILLQEIWRFGIGWDDEIPSELDLKWKLWLGELQGITSMKIPRCYGSNFYSTNNRELHIFCDASEKAFCAVAYWRMEGESIKVAFVTAKTHVAPLKSMSVPRLELQAAVMATRLSKTVVEEHSVPVSRVVFWSDSSTVLFWIRADGKKYQQFVAHRVGEVQESTDPSQWRWLPTKENVADEGTRNNTPADLTSGSRWLNGPSFLRLSEENWPKEKNPPPVDVNVLEQKREFVGLVLNKEPLIDITRFSKWTRLVRTTAWVLRFVINCRSQKLKIKNEQVELTVAEMFKAESWWWGLSQGESYSVEIDRLSRGQEVQRDSSLLKLSPMLDQMGILRIRGRLMADERVNEGQRYPVILHPKNRYTKLLIDHEHQLAGHHGMERVVNSLRQQYYIPQIRVAVRAAWSNCQKCKNRRARPAVAEMGNLPQCRLNSNIRPFTVTGVDYFGPIGVTVRRSHEKRYGVLFTCMSTRAIHLELAGSLSTDCCIMALRRFAARRGQPKELWSDNGTNFRGADNELRKALEELNQSRIETEMSMKGIQWHFIPPLAPHMGGAWERLIRATKIALEATLNEQYPREETLITVLAEAEHTVNSRPLTFVSLDPADEEALTPNHFLIGSSGSNPAQGLFNHDDLCLRRQWRISQRYADMFWKRWVKEYLPTLTRRTKWYERKAPVKIGDVVIVADDALGRNQWPKGIITAVFPGKDNQVRVVEVKTSNSTYRRPITRICVLDVHVLGEDAAASAPGGAMLSSPLLESKDKCNELK